MAPDTHFQSFSPSIVTFLGDGATEVERLSRGAGTPVPTLAALATEIAERRSAGGERRPPLAHHPRRWRAPLSYAQQRLWSLDRIQPGSAALNLPVAFRLEGPLQTAALERALAEVVQRQGSLRTTFVLDQGFPMQVVSPAAAIHLPQVDLSALPEAGRQDEARELARVIAGLPFDLARGPLVRAALLRLDPCEHVAVLSLHRIVTDNWSSGVLAREIGRFYAAHAESTEGAEGTLLEPPPLPVQYTDFAAWQRQWLRGEVFDEQLGWWRDRLRGAPALSDLPADRPRPGTLSGRGATRSFALPAELLAALYRLCRRQGTTLFMALLAGFQVLFHRLTGREEMLLGTDVANRDQTELEGMIGFFANQLVLRGDLSGNPSFREVLRRARAAALDAYAHQDLPFERVVEACGAVRDPDAFPFFQVKLVMQDAPFEARGLAGLDLVPLDLEKGISQLDLVLTFRESDGRLQGRAHYSTDLFQATTVERWLNLYIATLLQAVERPDASIAELEQHVQFFDWQNALAGSSITSRKTASARP